MPAAVATITASVSSSYGGTTQAVVFMSLTPPAVAAQGALWYSLDNGRLHVFYDQGGGVTQWLQIGV